MSDWIPTCKEIGGPVNVNLDYCLHQDTGCDAFKKGHCNFDEQHVLANVPGSFPQASCQVSMCWMNMIWKYYSLIQLFQEFCQNYPGCNFFYTDVHFCTLFSEKALYCDGLAGPADPKQSFCTQDTTTQIPMVIHIKENVLVNLVNPLIMDEIFHDS